MRLFFVVFCLMFSVAHPAFGHAEYAPHFDTGVFRALPVMHEGRIKPLDSFARIYLRRFSERDALEDMSAVDWLSEVFFHPNAAMERRVFYIPNNEVKRDLGLVEGRRYFSFRELSKGFSEKQDQVRALLQADAEGISETQSLFLEIYDKHLAYLQLMRSFSLFLPLDVPLPKNVEKRLFDSMPEGSNFLALYKAKPALLEEVGAIVDRKGDALDLYSEEERLAAEASLSLSLFHAIGQQNFLLRVIPSEVDWISPWQVLFSGEGSLVQSRLMALWEEAVLSYRNADHQGFQRALDVLYNQPHVEPHKFDLHLEVFYNAFHFYDLAIFFYFLAFVLSVLCLYRYRSLRVYAFSCFSIALVLQAFSLGVRMVVLDRPPVTTLYESLLFVSLISAFSALIYGAFTKKDSFKFSSLAFGAFIGFFLLVCAPYLINRGESLEMVAAVLNTNFWLTTHVLTITAGYAFCIFAALIAHGYLFLRASGQGSAFLNAFEHWSYRVSLIALMLTAVGTALGGVWADQSWGRFWGWDPKENGALLIVLWLIWVQHGRIAGASSVLFLQALMAYMLVVVALAWFGVNLLNVGLHTYGFIEGIAYFLGAFVVFETLLIVGFYGFIKWREARLS